MKTKYKALLLVVILFMPVSLLNINPKLNALDIYPPNGHKVFPPIEPTIFKRADWDTLWPQIKVQYERPIGTPFTIRIDGVNHYRTAKAISYAQVDSLVHDSTDVYSITLHNSQVRIKPGQTEVDALYDLIVSHITYRKWGDIAYHFFVGHLGGFYEGRPVGFMGVHAGSTAETIAYIRKKVIGWLLGPNIVRPEHFLIHFIPYVGSQKFDPDYKNIGVLLPGNFETDLPPDEQIECSFELVLWLMEKYDVPLSRVYYHRDMRGWCEDRGYVLISSRKTCPGVNFISKEEYHARLAEYALINYGKDIRA